MLNIRYILNGRRNKHIVGLDHGGRAMELSITKVLSKECSHCKKNKVKIKNIFFDHLYLEN